MRQIGSDVDKASTSRQISEAQLEFIDFVAHELKQPMTAIRGYTRMLTLGIGGELTDTQAEFVGVINSNASRMERLVGNLLEIARLEAGRIRLRMAPVQLHEVVEATLGRVRAEIESRSHSVDIDLASDLPPVLGDRERLIQILANLIGNACRYTPNGGSIQIRAELGDDARVPPGHLQVLVSDTGIGMSSQELDKLGVRFFRADHELVRTQHGAGLGVSIARELVALHGGRFTVESEPGLGSTFRFTVPVASEHQV